MTFPERFLEQTRALLGEEELQQYLAAMERPYEQGVRANTQKVSPKELRRLLCEELGADFLEETVPWAPAGSYLSADAPALSHSPYYYAGLYYLQEPSAMAPASILPIEPGDRVLDLCAAPGGKTTALGAKLAGSGVLVANDISPSRAKALLKNAEIFGLSTAIVSSEAPYKLAEHFPGYFTKVLIDAPCSGEGMFRKDPSIMKNWAQYGNAYYAAIQKEILESVPQLLAEGGMLLYSTCTYSPIEDERMIEQFLQAHPDFSLLDFPKTEGMMCGRPEWTESGLEAIARTAHFWPHRLRGEGHYAALLQRRGGDPAQPQKLSSVFSVPEAAFSIQEPVMASSSDRSGRKKERGRQAGRSSFASSRSGSDKAALAALRSWEKEALTVPLEQILPSHLQIFVSGENVYASPLPPSQLSGLRVLRPGLLLGQFEHDHFEPSQALAMTLLPEQVRHVCKADHETALRYLKGETLEGSFEEGWNLICIGVYPLGWGKASGGVCKNKYLKSWRMLR